MKDYEKALLYAYPVLEDLIEAADAGFVKSALASYSSGKSAYTEAEKLIEKIWEKDLYIYVKLNLDHVLSRFNAYELKHFSYKYWKDLPPDEYESFDASSRAYFRRQVRLAAAFRRALEKEGLTEAWFDRTCMKTDFFPALCKRIAARHS